MNAALEYIFIEVPTRDEISGIIRLYRQQGWWGEGPDDPDHVRRLAAGSHSFLTVRAQAQVIGMGRAISDGASDAYIQDVTVDPRWRGKGLGTRIIQKIIERLEADRIFWIALIAEQNSHPFYRKLGFAPMADSTPMLRFQRPHP